MDEHKKPDWTGRYLKIPRLDDDSTLHKGSLDFLHKRIIHNLKELNIHFLFPIQKAVIPFLIHPSEDTLSPYASDVCVSAETGQGKTFCYVLPIVHNLMGRVIQTTRCITLIPTRELALQVFNCFELFAKPVTSAIDIDDKTELKVGCLIGQSSFAEERNILYTSPDIIVCTPGRLIEHYNYKDKTSGRGISFSDLKWIVIDEADSLLSQPFEDWYEIFNGLKNSNKLHFTQWHTQPAIRPRPIQKILLSATMTKDPQKLAKLRLNKPIFFLTASKGTYATPKNLSHLYTLTKDSDKPLILMLILNQLLLLNEQSIEADRPQNIQKLLIFCQSKENTHRLTRLLQLYFLSETSSKNCQKDLDTDDISTKSPTIYEFSAKYSQNYRNQLINQYRSSYINALICSDVAARGLDISDVDMVINYDVPHKLKTYIHRSGRTARAGRSGYSLTLLKSNQIRFFVSNLHKGGIQKESLKEWNHHNLRSSPSNIDYQKLLKMLEICLQKEKSGYMLEYEPLDYDKLKAIEADFDSFISY